MPSSTGKGKSQTLFLEARVVNRNGETVYKFRNRTLDRGIEDLRTISLEKGDS